MITTSKNISVEQFLFDTQQSANCIFDRYALYVEGEYKFCTSDTGYFEIIKAAYLAKQNGYTTELIQLAVTPDEIESVLIDQAEEFYNTSTKQQLIDYAISRNLDIGQNRGILLEGWEVMIIDERLKELKSCIK